MGIGEATARRAVAEGARGLIHGIEPVETEEVAKTLGMPFCVGDLAAPRHCEELVSTAVEEFGQLHGLVNNAGVVWRNLIEETDAAFYARCVGKLIYFCLDRLESQYIIRKLARGLRAPVVLSMLG